LQVARLASRLERRGKQWVVSSVPRDDIAARPAIEVARVLRRDIDAACNAIDLPWSNGQAEGQINRLKTIKRGMYGRAGPELLRARMKPIKMADLHTK
jgi:transposase